MSKATVTGGENGLYSATIQIDDGHTEVVSIYSADLTEDLSGEVGVLEIAGNRSLGQNVQPGFEGNAVYNAARDGELYRVPQKDGSQPASGIFYNWSLFPGWQRWRSKYRYATISALSGDTCTVTFEACIATDTPDGKQLDCNQVASMSATIEYMSCNGAAFTDGDEVVVELTHTQGVWTSAKVIGFKSEPKGCYWEPWGSTLCTNHNWMINAVRHGAYSFTPCPELPFGDHTLSDGILSFSYTETTPGYISLWTLGWEDYVSDPLPVGVTECVYKISASYGGGSGVRLYFYDHSWNFVYSDVVVGDGSPEISVDITSIGTVEWFGIICYTDLNDPITYGIDYIDFR